jgi:HK97 family phage portal protein
MAFWDWLAGAFRRRGAPVDVFTPEALGQAGMMVTGAIPYGVPPVRGSRELHVAAKKEPWLYAVVNKIAEDFAAVPWELGVARDKSGNASPGRAAHYQRCRGQVVRTYKDSPRLRKRHLGDLKREANVEPLYDHPLLSLLDRPNPLMTGVQFRALLQRFMDLPGECFAIKERNAFGMPVQLWPTPNFWCLLTPYIGYDRFRFSYGLFQREVPSTEVLWMKHLDPENPYARGTGPGFALGDVIEAYAYALKTEKAVFYNNGLPSGVMALEGASEEDIKALKVEWEKSYRGFWNGMRLAWVNFKAQFTPFAPKFADQQLLELMKEKRDTIIQVYGVPPEVLGIVEHSNKATAMASKSQYAEGVLTPRCESFRSIWQERIVPEFDESLVLEYESPTPDDDDFNLEVATAAPETRTVNEWRELQDLPPLDGPEGDELYNPSNTLDGLFGGGSSSSGDKKSLRGRAAPVLLLPAARAEGEGEEDDDKKQPDWNESAIGDVVAAVSSDAMSSAAVALERLVEEFGQDALDAVIEMAGDDAEVPDGTFDMRDPNVRAYMEQLAGEQITNVTDTTKQRVREFLEQAYDDGLTIDEIAAELANSDNFAFGDSRAELIARTEVLRGSNFGTLQGYRQSTLIDQKEWIHGSASSDPRDGAGDKADHRSLDAKKVGLDATWTEPVYGDDLDYPGDGPPRQCCNCHCTLGAAMSADPAGDDEKSLRRRAFAQRLRAARDDHHQAQKQARAKWMGKLQPEFQDALDAQRRAVVKALQKAKR